LAPKGAPILGDAEFAMKKALGETQTLRAGCSKAEPKIFAPCRPPSRGRRMAKI